MSILGFVQGLAIRLDRSPNWTTWSHLLSFLPTPLITKANNVECRITNHVPYCTAQRLGFSEASTDKYRNLFMNKIQIILPILQPGCLWLLLDAPTEILKDDQAGAVWIVMFYQAVIRLKGYTLVWEPWKCRLTPVLLQVIESKAAEKFHPKPIQDLRLRRQEVQE